MDSIPSRCLSTKLLRQNKCDQKYRYCCVVDLSTYLHAVDKKAGYRRRILRLPLQWIWGLVGRLQKISEAYIAYRCADVSNVA